jgi:hypothetical protein
VARAFQSPDRTELIETGGRPTYPACPTCPTHVDFFAPREEVRGRRSRNSGKPFDNHN